MFTGRKVFGLMYTSHIDTVLRYKPWELYLSIYQCRAASCFAALLFMRCSQYTQCHRVFSFSYTPQM
uniref:Ovule protein n=1 Tax=Caenorhabditis tropicalis TaxID=1561998 RepID=A0A1I7UPW0_9PELO